MAESEHDDLADALSRMSGTDADEAPIDFETPAPVRPPVVRPATVRPPAVSPTTVKAPTPLVRPAAPVPVMPRAPRPAAPVASPAAPVVPPAPVVVTPRPQRPATPVARPAAPVVAAPPPIEAVPDEPADETHTDAETGIFDDGDSVIVPAPEATAFVPRTASLAARRAKVRRHKNLELLRTLIPVLLTTGVIFFAFGFLRITVSPDSVLFKLPSWVGLAFFAGSAFWLALAAVLMFAVKKLMRTGVV